MATKFPTVRPPSPATASFYVYRITCRHPQAPARYYYGCRTCYTPPQQDDYWSRSASLQALRLQLGPQWFTKKICSVHPTRAQALAKEVRLHAYFDVKNHPLFFNKANQTSTRFTPGPPSAATRAKLSLALRGNHHMLGRTHTPAARQKIAAAMRGKQHALGRCVSAVTRQKIAAARGSHAPFAGRTHSAETRALISQAMQGRHCGKRHSMATRHKISLGMQASHAARQAASRVLEGLPASVAGAE